MRRKPGALVPLEYAICETAAGLHRSGVEEFHGYELAKRLGDIADKRLLTAYGTLYRALGRMEHMGLLKSRWEDPAIPARENQAWPPTVSTHGCRRVHRSRSRGGRRVHRPPRPETARLRLTIMLQTRPRPRACVDDALHERHATTACAKRGVGRSNPISGNRSTIAVPNRISASLPRCSCVLRAACLTTCCGGSN